MIHTTDHQIDVHVRRERDTEIEICSYPRRKVH